MRRGTLGQSHDAWRRRLGLVFQQAWIAPWLPVALKGLTLQDLIPLACRQESAASAFKGGYPSTARPES
jgi:hypothetical protein